jgi:cyanophycin synthetase
LLQVAKLPIFNDPYIRSIAPLELKRSQYQAQLSLPFHDHVPIDYLQRAINLSVVMMSRLFKYYPNPIGRDELDSLINKQLLQPVKKLMIGGVSTLPILRAAYASNVPVRHMGGGLFILGWGRHARTLSRSAIEQDSSIGAEISTRKDKTTKLLSQLGIPVPIHRVVSSLEQAIEAAESISYPVVVKPANCERSEGVTTLIHNQYELKSAFEHAVKFSKLILVERQIPGTCYRLLIAAGKYLYCVERGARALKADGKHNIQELIAIDKQQNIDAPLWRRKKIIEPDEQTLNALKIQGYDLNSIPKMGSLVRMRIIESTEWSETSVDVTDKVHPDNIELAERTAAGLRLSNAGIDLMTRDISRPWWDNHAIITEVNYRPHFGASEAAQQRMGIFIQRIMQDSGRIPIEIFIGDTLAYEEATQRIAQLAEQNITAYLCAKDRVMSAQGEVKIQNYEQGLYGACRVMLQNKNAEALIVVIQDSELLQTGLPFDAISQIHVASHSDLDHQLLLQLNSLKPYITA